MKTERHFLARFAAVSLLLAGLIPSTGASQEKPATAFKEQAITREKAVWKAAAEGDKAGFSTLVGDDARMIFTSGVMTRQQYLDSSSERKITGYELSDFQVLTPKKDTVIVIYRAQISGVFKGKQASYAVREASVWIHREKGWVAILNQETPL